MLGMKKKVLFIINPISGSSQRQNTEMLIQERIDFTHFNIEIKKTAYKGHANILAREAVEQQIDIVVAAGGDGTINEVASALVGTNVVLGILPIGSGNGLARHLAIPIQTNKAIELLNRKWNQSDLIDVGKINDHYFFSIGGIGYDAKVAYDFNRGTERGFKGYFKHIIKNYFQYNSDNYIVQFDDKKLEKRAFFITFANSSQWGYNVKIQPSASIKDEKLNMLICKKPHFLTIGYVMLELFLGRIEQSRFMEVFLIKEANITTKTKKPIYLHIDGDAVELVEEVNVTLISSKLRVITGE